MRKRLSKLERQVIIDANAGNTENVNVIKAYTSLKIAEKEASDVLEIIRVKSEIIKKFETDKENKVRADEMSVKDYKEALRLTREEMFNTINAQINALQLEIKEAELDHEEHYANVQGIKFGIIKVLREEGLLNKDVK